MRSSVGIMLSQTCGEPTVSHPDYEQNALHHSCLLVLLRGIGPAKPRSLQKIFERVRRINNVKITDSLGNQRDIWIRYVHDYPVENSLWGDFQTHRRLLGLITIGKFDTQLELNELCRLHESLKVKYNETLFDSRAIFFGPCTENTQTKNVEVVNDSVPSKTLAETSNKEKTLTDEYSTPSNFKSAAFFYQENDVCNDLDKNMIDFISSLFWILESKRLKRSCEKIDKAPLLLAPFEKKDFVGLDMESRTSRKRCIGRITKNLADLTLQAGLLSEALNLYHAAIETLRAISDSLWLGAAEEGLCSTSSILLYPKLRYCEVFQRNCSLQEGTSPQKFNAYVGRRRSSDFASKSRVIIEHVSDAPQENLTTNLFENSIASNSSSSSSVSSILTNSSTTSSESTTVTGNLENKGTNSTILPVNLLTPDEIINQYRKAIINYSKYRNAGIIETEAALKAARICIEQNRNLDVVMFLQNVLYINVNMTEADRVKRFEVLTDLYQQIGYRRKAAFCQRLAAWKHVAQGNPTPDWSQSYRLMLECFPGYMLSLDPLEVINNASGWPMLQIDLLQQLIMAAKRLGHSALATRHMTYLLQTQWKNMSSSEQKEMALQLQNLSAQCEGSPVALVLENGIVIPPANLTDIPYCSQLLVNELQAHLRALKIIITKIDSGPFLFTPIHFSSLDRRTSKKVENKISFFWVQNELSEVTLKLKNTLPFELTVSDMRLLTAGIVFESLPQTVVLQPDVTTQITLHGTPLESGNLEIQGYSTHTLGVKSNCRLKHMKDRLFPANYVVEVIPTLPKITAQTSLPKTATFSSLSNSNCVITSAALTIYKGEKSECIITLKNDSMIPIEHLELSLHSNVDNDLLKKIFNVDQNLVQSKLPIAPNSSIEFPLLIYGEADFLCPISSQTANIVDLNGGPQSLSYSALSSGHASLPSRVSSPVHQIVGRKTDTNSSFRSSNSSTIGLGGHTSLAALPPLAVANGQIIEAQLQLRYSGGKAMQDGYCRQCAISFVLELLPSVQLTGWDVLPAETASQFYLVLDISNLTNQEMSLNYTSNKNILIEAKESCRVPIPVDRCSLERLSDDVAEIEKNSANCDSGAILIMPTQGEITERICSNHISERVNLSWTLTGTETQGVASLKGIRLTNSMIDLITVAPLQWNVMFNNTVIQPQSEFVCSAGECVSLHIEVGNQSQSPLHHLALTIQFYQDYQNGVHSYHLETRVMMTGANQIVIPILDKNNTIDHDCSVVFFTPGRFKANLQCRSLPISNVMNSNSLLPQQSHQIKENIGTAGNNLTNSLQRNLPSYSSSLGSSNIESCNVQNYADALVGLNNNNFDQNQHVWKFIPPVEITVIEGV
ncbi:protein brunelleschi [Condylostylus longicornis]|uniref:protein brunelleschi n=1 Tax=Condylostylus longicornis TaxID=2530218 RepID=UPI00244E2A04|nr:protein brunelleschi [Condylostylus longicornis]